jgi:uncharacterized iron-regulated protein
MVSELWTRGKAMNLRYFPIWLLGAIWSISLILSQVMAGDFSGEQQRILQALRGANIVYLGEIHDSATDHADQLAIVQNLQQSGQPLAIGLEMFQRPYQGVLDRYLAGEISATELQTQSEYTKRWGFPWENYGPLLQWAQQQRVPVIALNTPTEITRKVARNGLESLVGEDLKYVPPIAEIDFSNQAYRDLILASYRQHQRQAMAHSKSFERFHAAQLLWDETMAATAANFYRQAPQRRLVIIAGRDHIRYGHGIPSRVTRRLRQWQLAAVQKSVMVSSDEHWDQSVSDFRFRAKKTTD